MLWWAEMGARERLGGGAGGEVLGKYSEARVERLGMGCLGLDGLGFQVDQECEVGCGGRGASPRRFLAGF